MKKCKHCQGRIPFTAKSPFCTDECRNKYYNIPVGEDPFHHIGENLNGKKLNKKRGKTK